MKHNQQVDPTFVDLIYEHQGILRRICFIYASLQQDREDLYQEILLQSWRSFASFNGRSKFSTWLYRVALNTALLRRRREPGKLAITCDLENSVDVAVAQDRSEEGAEIALLHRCIQELSPLNRAIILFHLEKRTYEEIAEITGLSRSAVSVRLVRIKKELRKLLIAKGYHED